MSHRARLTTCAWGPGPPGEGDPVESNLHQAIEMIDRAALDRSDIIVLPELCAHQNMRAEVAHKRAQQIAEEFGLDRRIPYYAHCRRLRDEALRHAGRD